MSMSPASSTAAAQRPTRGQPSIDDLLETHKPLFRRRKASHLTHPPPPCLSCSIKGMCCIVYADVRCQRCERNGEEVCVRQKEDLTKPEEAEKSDGGGEGSVTHRTRRGGRGAPSLDCMVYSLDPAFLRDKRRLLGIAADMLDGTTTYVHGTPVRLAHTRNFALPLWHQNDRYENQRDRNYRMSTNGDFLGEFAVRRAAIAEEIRRLSEKAKLDQERRIEERRLAMAKQKEVAGLGQQD